MIIYTDGSAHPNPGPGGFGVVILDDNENLISTYGRQTDSITTNNREELKPIVSCLLGFGVKDPKRANWPIVYTDSAYAYNTFTSWMFSWASKGWRKSDKKTPENLDLIQKYYDYWQQGYRIELRKCAGHQGHKWNELADGIATGKIKPIIDGNARKDENK